MQMAFHVDIFLKYDIYILIKNLLMSFQWPVNVSNNDD